MLSTSQPQMLLTLSIICYFLFIEACELCTLRYLISYSYHEKNGPICKIKAHAELNTLDILFAELLTEPNESNEAGLLKFRAKYLSSVSALSDDSRYTTDKMPQNFFINSFHYIGTDRGKIVHIRRKSAETC